MDSNDERGFQAYLDLVKEQREEAMEYVRADDDTFALYAPQLLRDNVVVSSPEDILLSNMEQG